MPARASFDDLLADGASAPIDGWDFSWFAGRASEERTPWGYARLLADRMARATTALDVQTGGGEVLAEALARAPRAPRLLAATEGWPPNLRTARDNLRRVGGHLVWAPDRGPLPFRDESFDLVVSRHPTVTGWDEVARVLGPGGTYLSQQVGAGSLRELTDALMGPRPVGTGRSPERAVAAARAAGLTVVDLREATLETAFHDVGAVVAFLRKVVWIVPGFTVEAYRQRLAALHERIEIEGRFVAHAQRFLVEARKEL